MSKLIKLVVYVPKSHAEEVRNAMGDAGAGKIGNYNHCSFSVEGIGRFLPLQGANPTIGEVGKHEEVIEERIEFVCEKENIKRVIGAMKEVHPYEAIAYDIYPLLYENEL